MVCGQGTPDAKVAKTPPCRNALKQMRYEKITSAQLPLLSDKVSATTTAGRAKQ